MRKLAIILLLCGFAVPVQRAAAQTNEDREAVRQAVLDYVEGVYNAEPARIERSVHPKLTKLGFMRRQADGNYRSAPMTFEQLKEVAATYNKDGKTVPANAPKEITVFDVLDQTATAKLVAYWGIDYFHLAKFDGKWMIVNVIWQSPPKK